LLVKETGLDQQLKSLGYWDAWQKRRRGAANHRLTITFSPQAL